MTRQIQSVQRAAAILQILASGPRQLGVVELARCLELPKGTLHGILSTLRHVGFVEQDRTTGKYHLGASLLHLGDRFLDVSVLRTRAISWADSLASRSQEAVQIGVLHNGKVLILHHVFRPAERMQPRQVGTLLPIHATALGKVLWAADPSVALIDAQAEQFTSRTIVEPAALRAELALVSGNGWAAEFSELTEGEAAIAAPIRDDRDVTVGAIGVRGAVERMAGVTDQRALKHVVYVQDAARAISREFGANLW